MSFCIFQIFRTERIKNNLNPTFTKGFILEYCFEELQKLKFSMYDVDNKTTDLRDDDLLGHMECTLGQVSYRENPRGTPGLPLVSYTALTLNSMP